MKLTQRNIEQLALPAGKTEALIFDEDVPGFGLRMRAGGSRTFIVQYAIGGRQRRMTIGSPNILDAPKARETARNLLAKVRLGHDPAADRAEARVHASDEPFGAMVEQFLARQERRLRPRTYVDVSRYLQRYWKPLHTLPLARIGRVTVAARLDTIASEHGLVTADRARAALSSFFTWAVGQGLSDANPVVGTNKHYDGERSRDRELTDRELAVIWHELPDLDYGAIVRLLISTGQRREEIGALRWTEVDLHERKIALPPERTKNHRRHDVPLSSPALAILSPLPRRADRDLVFGAEPRKSEIAGGFQGWSKCKAALDKRTQSIRPWRLHDLRRSVATRMADLGVHPHIIEAALNHISGHKAGVAGVYNRSSYAAEKRAALDLWGKHVQGLIQMDNPSPNSHEVARAFPR